MNWFEAAKRVVLNVEKERGKGIHNLRVFFFEWYNWRVFFMVERKFV